MVRVKAALLASALFASSAVFAAGSDAAFRIGKKGPRVSGFIEVASGAKFGSDTTKRDDFDMLEERLQLKTAIYPKSPKFLKNSAAELNLKADLLLDEYYDGKASYDIREADLLVSPAGWMDLKLGRQVLTWGTGDYLFINDLFPKDYVSFYIGRHDEYLKRPSDAVKASLYLKAFNLDIAAIPIFEPNTIPKGDRLSFFDSFQGGIAGRNSERYLSEPARQPDNAEYAIRAYRNFGSYEAASYMFRGFYKMPRGYLDEARRILFYPRLDAYGASLRGPALGGIANLEFGYYNSRQDSNGDNRLIDNSMAKMLIGYEKELRGDLRLSFQYLYEQTLDYANYRVALLPADFRWDEGRHLATFRVSKLFRNQTVKTGLFAFVSPSDMDVYLRPTADYDITDDIKISAGANLVWGRDGHTEFGQMENDKNIYLRVRYSF